MKCLPAALMLLASSYTAQAQYNPWEQATSTYQAKPAAIGSYANGCLAGAKALPLTGEGYQVIRAQRHRFYGHPSLISFVSDYAKQLRSQGINNILIADMSMPRGGQFNYGHSSHQIGLDVDIWLRLEDDLLVTKQLASPYAVSVVDKKNLVINKNTWKDEHKTMLKVAAQDQRVARIFINPIIKQQLCDEREQDDDWLQKIRPWWGHSSHMHVRLVCPVGDNLCSNQKPIAKGHGCEELSWWREQLRKTPSFTKPKKAKPLKVKPLPCMPLVENLQVKQ